MERRLTAILVADMVGYSRLMEADEMSVISRQKENHANIIDPGLAAHRGRIVKTTGDGFLAEFPSVVEAVNFAAAMQRAITAAEADTPDATCIAYRVGINLGDVVHEGGDIHGNGVNVAARLEPMADPGGICISGAAHDQMRAGPDLGFEDMGEVQVKNITRPIRAWRVLLDGEKAGRGIAAQSKRSGSLPRLLAALVVLIAVAAGGWWWSQQPDFEPADLSKYAYELPEKPSIAVLAFDNLSGDEAIDYVGDGLADSIISALTNFPKLFVIARNSSFHYKDKPTSLHDIAQDLGVRYLLEGAVQQANGDFRVTARLVDALDGQNIWSKTYNRSLTTSDLFSIQDSITQDIALALDAQLVAGEQLARSAFEDAGDMETFILVQRMIAEYQKFTKEGNLATERLANEVLARKPDNILALIHLSWVHYTWVLLGLSADPAQSLAAANKINAQALEVAPNDPFPIVQKAWFDLAAQNHDAAIEKAERAMELYSGGGILSSLAGWVFSASGRPERGVELLQYGMRTEPYPPDWVPINLAHSLMMVGRYDEAKAILSAQLEITTPNIKLLAVVRLAIIAVEQGDLASAKTYVATLQKLNPQYSIAGYLRFNNLRDKAYLEGESDALRRAGVPE